MLLDDIIALLADSEGSLNDALLKMKILLRQLGHKELVGWVNSELTGYPSKSDVPSYRVVQTTLHGTVFVGDWQYKDTLLPVSPLDKELRQNITELAVSSSIGTIEEQVKTYRKDKLGLVRQLPPDYTPSLLKALAPGAVLTAAWCEINMAQFEGILIQVRSRLLDFCLELREALGAANEHEVQAKAASIDTPRMFQTFVYGGTVILGGQNIQVNNQLGDINGMLGEVAKLGFEHGELEDLRRAVLDDKNKNESPNVTDGETGKWYMKALKKVGKGAVNASVEVVSSVIIKALEHYAKGG